MGTPLAPPYTTIYYGIHKEKFLPHHSQCVIYYRRFIDDVIGIWCTNKNLQLDALEWNAFKKKMNKFPGLTWEFSEPSTSVDFMDMTITINKSNKIETTLFEKRLNLHLYIPPLCPSTRVTPGDNIQHTVSNFYPLLIRKRQITTNKGFFKCLIARGYKGDEIRGLFHKAIAHAKIYNGPTTDNDTDYNHVILHLPFHPNDPASFHIQEA